MADEDAPEQALVDVLEGMKQWDEALWCLTALAVAWSTAHPAEHRAAAAQVLGALGQIPVPPAGAAAQLAAQAAAPLQQAAGLVSGRVSAWHDLPDEALIAQGEASGQLAVAFQRFMLPMLPGLADALAAPGARMLDVGTGVGAIARGFAASFSALHVTGIDLSDRVLALGRGVLEGSAVQGRVDLKQRNVTDLSERSSYDLIWLPAPFLAPADLSEGLTRCGRALRPGGCLLVGHGKLTGKPPLEQALTRWKTLTYGGTAWDDEQASKALTDAGLVHVFNVPTPPGAPAITVGRSAATA